ncbi:hypothetical protein FGB62_44g012 [Gracilaria domingensis]|nr:hypothetical protein FGB62_44g012 [Gracilaria domingensis]
MGEEVKCAKQQSSELNSQIATMQSEQGRLLVDKETAERRLEMARSDAQFQAERLSNLEAQNRELNSTLDSAKSKTRQIEESLLRHESRADEDRQKINDLRTQVDRLRSIEGQYTGTQMEMSRLKSHLDEATTLKTRLLIEKEGLVEKLRVAEERFNSEKRSLLAEHRLEMEEIRRGSEISFEPSGDLKRTGGSTVISTSRGPVEAQNDNQKLKNNVMVAVACGVGVVALKVLAQVTDGKKER